MASLSLSLGPKTLNVKVTPGKTLAEVLQEFAQKYDLKPEDWTLASKGKQLDLSLPYRLSGLPQNAKLEVVRRANKTASSDGLVTVGLQLPDGVRAVMNVPASTTLWALLLQCEKEKSCNIVASADKGGFYRQPVLAFLNKELSTNTEFRQTTLESLGMTPGSSNLIRLNFRATKIPINQFQEADKQAMLNEAQKREQAERERQERLLRAQQEAEEQRRLEQEAKERVQQMYEEEMRHREQLRQQALAELQKQELEKLRQLEMEEQERRRREQEAYAAAVSARQQAQAQPTFNPNTLWEGAPAPAGPVNTAPAARPAIPTVISVNPNFPGPIPTNVEQEIQMLNSIPDQKIDRQPKVFAPSETPFDPTALDLPDDFYEMTPEDVAFEMQLLKEKQQEQENASFKTKLQRERDRLKKLSKFKKCYIRIRFPDRIELQGTFLPQEKTEHIVQFIRECLNEPDLNFFLYTAPPITRLSDTLNLRDQGFLPAALVHFGLPKGVSARSPFLKSELLKDIQEKVPPPTVYTPASTMNFALPAQFQVSTPAPAAAASAPTGQTSASSSTSNTKTIPKWFAAGLRKK